MYKACWKRRLGWMLVTAFIARSILSIWTPFFRLEIWIHEVRRIEM